MTKKILIYLVCISLLFSSVIFSVSADSVAAGTSDPHVIDLLTDDYYYFTGNNSSGEQVQNVQYYTPFASVSGYNAEFWWANSSADDDVEFVTFTIQATSRPSEVYFRRWQGGSNGLVTATYKHSSGNLHLYTVTISRSQIAQCGIKVVWNSPYTGMFGVRSVRGFTDSAYDVPTSSYRFAYDYRITGEYIRNETSSSGSGATLPFAGSQIFVDDTDRRLLSGTMYIFLSDVQRELRDIDKLTTFFWCYDDEPEVSVSVTDYSGAVLHVADFTLDQALSRTTTGSVENPIYCYELNADFLSYYVGNNQITISIKTDSVPYNVSGDYQVYTYVESIFVYPPVDDLPWYKVFFNWCAGVWNSLTDKIVQAISGGSEAQQAGENIQGAADKLDDASEALDAVPKPEINWGGYFSTISGQDGSVLNVMLTITNQEPIEEILLLMFILMLTAYMLFGKR